MAELKTKTWYNNPQQPAGHDPQLTLTAGLHFTAHLLTQDCTSSCLHLYKSLLTSLLASTLSSLSAPVRFIFTHLWSRTFGTPNKGVHQNSHGMGSNVSIMNALASFSSLHPQPSLVKSEAHIW